MYTPSVVASTTVELSIQAQVIKQINAMSTEEKVGQLFIFGFAGKSFNKGIERKLQNLNPGALISFRRNLGTPYQIMHLNRNLQKHSIKYSRIPLLIMVDQEGGTVTRIMSKPKPPSALSVGLTKDPSIALKIGQITGNILRYLGFNQNLAPVADLSDPNSQNFIGSRSFGKDPFLVKNMVQSVAHGHIQSLVLPTKKHFPGHGDIIQDSHRELPKKLLTIEQLKKRDLIPFAPKNNDTRLAATMVAHIALPKIDPTGTPATFSKKIVTDLLRKDLQYKGLVITDDIEMSGARAFGSIGDRAISAILAGNDMVMVAWSYKKQKAAFKAVLSAVYNGKISMPRVHESLQRILYIKYRLNVEQQIKSLSMDKNNFNLHYKSLLQQLRKLTIKIAKQNIRSSMENHASLKASIGKQKTLYLFAASSQVFRAIKSKVPNRIHFIRLKRKTNPPFEKILANNLSSQGIVYISGTGTAKILEKAPLYIKKKLIIINTGHPGLIRNQSQYKAIFSVNTPNYLAGQWLGEFLTEVLPAKNRIPAGKSKFKSRVKRKLINEHQVDQQKKKASRKRDAFLKLFETSRSLFL